MSFSLPGDRGTGIRGGESAGVGGSTVCKLKSTMVDDRLIDDALNVPK